VEDELDRMLDDLVARDNAIRSQQDADAAEASVSDVASAAMDAADARIFVDQLHQSLSEVLPQVGPKLRRAVNYQVDQLINPFHNGSHHDVRFSARLGQRELHVNACGSTVALATINLLTQKSSSRTLGPKDLRRSSRDQARQQVIREFVESSIGL
jgi:hypothetical protein